MTDLDAMTRTLFGEARGEIDEGKAAVAWVIKNRAEWPNGPHWWGNTVAEVCRKPYQFSCWNASDPNSSKCAALAPTCAEYRELEDIARKVLDGAIPDPTEGGTHYHVRGLSPKWAEGKMPSASIGNHVFYRLGPGGWGRAAEVRASGATRARTRARPP